MHLWSLINYIPWESWVVICYREIFVRDCYSVLIGYVCVHVFYEPLAIVSYGLDQQQTGFQSYGLCLATGSLCFIICYRVPVSHDQLRDSYGS